MEWRSRGGWNIGGLDQLLLSAKQLLMTQLRLERVSPHMTPPNPDLCFLC